MNRQTFIDQFLPHKTPTHSKSFGEAPVNIALGKYWGKRNLDLNLPMNSSLSISLPGLGTQTQIQLLDSAQSDAVILNHKLLPIDHPFAQRVQKFLDLFRPDADCYFEIETRNSVPTGAGLASSASGYAALVLALEALFQWGLTRQQLSILARIGSGSASRSLFDGFAIWHRGEQADGLDSFAEPIADTWPELCIGLVKVDISEKPIGSTAGMQRTVETCHLYQAWPQQAEQEVQTLQQAIAEKNFSLLGQTAEHNALSMHATMIATWPPILYWQADSIKAMEKVWQLRQQGCEVYFTMDAGPNLKLLFEEADISTLQKAFPEMEIIRPFKVVSK
ncbi:diphosphomevalonate decarboxylase [Galenea microaerophila]